MDNYQQQGRQEIIYRYVAQKALQDLRSGTPPEAAVQQLLNTYPLFGYCRQEVSIQDKALLMEIASSRLHDLPLRRFALKLLQQFVGDQDVKEYFRALWDKPCDYEVRLEVLWGLLNYVEASEELYAEIGMHFDAANWDKWLPLIVEKLEGDAEEKVHVRELMKRFFNL